ncbi:uncharacterized protein HD556DRAFT_1463521 [Suillus plorans]|uniref:Uncharacterized protein n=1 Tax=Suillus plorans TaxID=116603 RepID=A0A9P7DLY0_9AGAM|nr:uncharacterized protein HD556DRAFT_1463521 [Suillus plorans]KAG1798094.1 hypothetical protein HD556DRAFT_1463521 [Suillus plorans]
MSTDWSIAFKPILDLHSKAIFAAGSSSVGKPVVRKIRRAILAAQDEQEEPIALPTSLKKAIKEYYAKSLKDKEEADEREAASRPREPSFYKKPLSEWDVAQKLFKQEIDSYDKAQQQSKGLEYSIKYRTGNAREWFNNMTPSQQQEVKFAMKKWNEEGAPEETQAIYRKNNLKKTLEDFAEQIRRTMGCRIVMLVNHKKKASQTLSVSLHETMPQNAKKKFSVSSSGIKEWAANGFESFGEWSKTEFYPSEDSDHAASDCEDGPVLPEIIVDDEGYAKLPLRDGIGLKGQHELIRSIFHTSYKVCTGGSRPVPWGVITASPSNYLEPGSVPTGFVVKDPSHMKTEELVVFIKAKDADIRVTGKSKTKVVSTLDLDEEDQGRPAPFASHFTERTTQPAAHETTPDDVAINDRYTFLETLSKNENYLELVDATRDLAILAKQNPISERHQDLPTWADWSWSENYLSEDIHTSYATLMASLNKLQTCPISGPSSAMPVILGIGLLYRESKRVIEYEEDEADPNTPFYLPHSAIDLQFLVALDEAVREVLFSVVGQIERLNKEGLSDEVEDEEMRMVVEKERHEVEEKDVESEENVVGGEEQQDELLLDKPVLAVVDATPRPVRQPIIIPQRRVPHGFFDDIPHRAHHASHPSTLRDRLSSLFHTDAHDTSSRPRPFHWVRSRLSGRPTGEDIGLHGHPSAVVDVPYAKGKRRNASARERRMKIPPLKPGNTAASTSRPPNSNTTQHSNSASQAQSSQAQAAVSPSTAPPAVTHTFSSANPHVTIRHAGRWTRFWLLICCTSTEYTHDHQ